jgi:2-amino-4-hydroxy-6-hydroxymethyldihydropteridine diphosphokinase
MEPVHPTCLLLGSNIQPEKNLSLGVAWLRPIVNIVRLSSVWETFPVGCVGSNYLNLAMLITTSLKAGELKEQCLLPLEARLGRVRSADKNAPRPIDIDILLFDGRLLDAHLFLYAYKAVPVAELLPDYRSDQDEPLAEVASRLAKATFIRKLDVQIDRPWNAS